MGHPRAIFLRHPLPREGLLIALAAALLQTALLGAPMDPALVRGIWDGQVQIEGWNPYAIPPADEALDYLRRDFGPTPPQTEDPSKSPPGLLLVFRLGALLEWPPLLFKMFFGAAHVLSITVLIRLLAAYQRSPRWALLYALHPSVLAPFAAGGHPGSLPALFILLALLHVKRQHRLALGLCAACATQTSLQAWILLPFLLRRWNAATLIPLAAMGLGLLLAFPPAPFAAEGYAAAWRQDPSLGSLRLALAEFGANPQRVAAWMSGLLLATLAAVRLRTPDPATGGLALAAAWTLGAPTISLASAALPAMLVPLRPIRSVAALSLAPLLVATASPWAANPTAAWAAAHAPFLALLALDALRGHFPAACPDPFLLRPAQSLSAVVADPGSADSGRALLDSLRQPDAPPMEIIWVCGSDASPSALAAAARGAQLVVAEGGRDRMLAAGIYRAGGDALLLLSSNMAVPPGALSRIVSGLTRTGKLGGAIGGDLRTDRGTDPLKARLLRRLAAYAGWSDHWSGQFVRREALADWGGYPAAQNRPDRVLARMLRDAEPPLLIGRGMPG